MREIRLSGSEGGGGREASPYPYPWQDSTLPGSCERTAVHAYSFHPCIIRGDTNFSPCDFFTPSEQWADPA